MQSSSAMSRCLVACIRASVDTVSCVFTQSTIVFRLTAAALEKLHTEFEGETYTTSESSIVLQL